MRALISLVYANKAKNQEKLKGKVATENYYLLFLCGYQFLLMICFKFKFKSNFKSPFLNSAVSITITIIGKNKLLLILLNFSLIFFLTFKTMFIEM
jgi:hypothetical protein